MQRQGSGAIVQADARAPGQPAARITLIW